MTLACERARRKGAQSLDSGGGKDNELGHTIPMSTEGQSNGRGEPSGRDPLDRRARVPPGSAGRPHCMWTRISNRLDTPDRMLSLVIIQQVQLDDSLLFGPLDLSQSAHATLAISSPPAKPLGGPPKSGRLICLDRWRRRRRMASEISALSEAARLGGKAKPSEDENKTTNFRPPSGLLS